MILIGATANSLYCQSFTIAYEEGGSAPSYNVNVASGIVGGTVTASPTSAKEGDKVTLTATPATGYEFGSWNITPSTVEVNANNQFTMPAANVNVSATFNEKTKYTVTLSDDNTQLTESVAGEGVTLPTRNKIGDWSFVGWSVTNVAVETSTKPTTIPAGNYTPTENITLYPVYSKSEGTSGTTTANVNISDYATAHSWQGSGAVAYTSIAVDDNITVSTTGTGNNGKYYSDWRLYQSGNGNAIVTAKDGLEIKNVTFVFTVSNTGALKYNGNNVTSGSKVDVNENSATFTVGNSGSATNGQVRVTAISVEYAGGGSTTYITTPPTPSEKTLIGIEVSGDAEELWVGDEFNHNGITVTATWADDYDNETTTIVTDECEYTGYDMTKSDVQTVTVTYQGESTTYEVIVNTIANTEATAYTVAKAKELINAGKGLNVEVYVKGTVVSIPTPWSDQYNNITYNISDDGKAESQQFQLYRCSTNGANEGDDVIAKGKLKKHNETYEFDAANVIVKHDKVATLSIADITVAKGEDINPVVTTNVTGEYLIEYVSNNEDVVIAVDDELATGYETGTATITATLVADGYKDAETTFKVTVVNPVTKYAITVAPMENGTVTASVAEAAAGDVVTLTVTPATGYELDALTVTGASGEVNVADGKFTMPAEAVTVSATFVEKAKYTVTIETPENGTLVVKDGETALESGAQVYKGTTLTIECTPAAGYQYKNWQYKEGEKNWATRTTGMTYEVKDNVSIRANFEVIPTYTIAWYEDGIEMQKDVNKLDGEAVTAYEVQSEINGKKFVGKWMKNVEIIEPQDEVPAYVDAPTTANATTAGNYYAVYATETGGQGGTGTTDVLNLNTTGVTKGSSTYTDWSGKTATSTAVYAGNSAGGSNSIQLRSKNSNSGVVTTTSGGNATKVAVEWNSETLDGRTLNVYGSTSAYTNASDLYSDETQGTLIGTIVKGTSTELDITGNYPYIGLRSAADAMYLSSISITYGGGGGSVTYSGYTTRPANTVKVESIELSNKTTEFYVDDEFVKATVTAHLDDNTTKDVTNVATFTGYDMTQVGTQTVTVTYLDKTATYDIEVKPQVSTPVFNLEPGTYEGTSKKVGISCETTGAKIYYTMTPGVAEPTLYTKQIDVTGETTIVAYAMVGDGSGKRTSESATAEYKLVSVFAPAISPETKTSNEPVAVTITQNSNLTGAKTYVKINNGEAQLYKNAFVVTSTSTVEAYTVAGENESDHVSETYTITAAPTPGGEPITATIVWAPTSQPSGVNSGSAINSYDLLCKVTSEGADYYDASRKDELVLTEILAANYTKYQALRVGSSGHGGTITLPITPAINVQSITFNAALYAGQTNTETMTVAVNGNPVATKTITTSVDKGFNGFTIQMDGTTTLNTITFSSSNYTYLRDVTIVGTTATPVPATGDFKLVTSTDDLVAGREYIVVSKPGDAIYGLSIDNADAHGVGSDGEAKTTKNWRRAETGVTLSENFYTANLDEGSKVSVLTLGGNKETNEWRFNSANGYLVKGATTSAETYLPLLLTADNSAKFSVNVRFDNVAELHFNGADSDRRIKWFSNPSEGVDYPRFGNYSNDNKNYSEVYLYWREAQNEVTLGELEANGIEDNDKVYTITDDLVVFKVVGNTAWAHDMAKSYAYRENTYDATWYGGYNADSYTQHNWVMLTFPEGTDMNNTVENQQLSNVKGTYHGHKGVSHEIVVSSFDKAAIEEENSVIANTYNMASFWDDNTYDYVTVLGKNFFFMNPKIEEVCHITEAVWNGTGFVVPANQTVEEVHLNSGDLKGGVKVNWAYNDGGAPAKIGADRYTFLAVVTKNASAHAAGGAGAPAKVAPSDCGLTDYVVYPLNFTVTSNIVTEVKDVDVAGREVKSVRFYDIAGRARSEAQP
ncbi:MAG: bacterial Ig-like domain-containing protein, partial [Bacteroidales bacterium]|nr:bacterial Ig-like domain-containing protein [Candidatus Sodaliphilus limicaballi]